MAVRTGALMRLSENGEWGENGGEWLTDRIRLRCASRIRQWMTNDRSSTPHDVGDDVAPGSR